MKNEKDTLIGLMASKSYETFLTVVFAFVVVFEAFSKPLKNLWRLWINRIDTKKDLYSVEKAMKEMEYNRELDMDDKNVEKTDEKML